MGAVSDNGPVSQLGAKALDHVHAKLKALAQDNRFKPEERAFLTDQWRAPRDADRERDQEELKEDAQGAIRRAVEDAAGERGFHRRTGRIRQAQKALEVIHKLTHDIRDASAQLNKLIGGIKPPGA